MTRFVRDGCFTGVVVISGFLSGGSALLALGGGSLLKSFASYQDNQDFGSAAITAVGTLAIGAIPLKPGILPAIKGIDQKTLVVVTSAVTSGVVDASSALEGKSVGNAIRQGIARAGLDMKGRPSFAMAVRKPMSDREYILANVLRRAA